MPSEEQTTSPIRPVDERTGQPVEPSAPELPAAPASAAGDAAGQPETGQQSNDDDQATATGGLSTAATQQDVGSPLRRQHRDDRLQPDHFPAKIIFLSGTLQGLQLDLGIAVNEYSASQSANLESPTEEGIRAGSSFKQITPRGFSLKLEFFDIRHDIQHLVENIFHIQEIDPETAEPPLLMLTLGDMTVAPVRCTNLRSTLDEPHAKDRGFRHGVIEVELELAGGKDSEHALAKPLLSTPLGDIRASQTEAERQRQGEQAVTKLLFEDCLGADGSEQVAALLEADKLQDVDSVLTLDANAFVQSAIAGFFSSEVLANEQIQQKLVADLALVMARNQYGTTEDDHQPFANAILTGDLSGLDALLQQQAPETQADYQAILEAIAQQDYSAILDQPGTAGDRLRRFGSCGLGMRQVSRGALQGSQGQEAQILKAMADFLGGPVGGPRPTDEEILARFGDLSPEQLKSLKNGHPYQSKAEFVQHLSQTQMGSVSGYAIWAQFNSTLPAEPSEPTTPIEEEEAIGSST